MTRDTKHTEVDFFISRRGGAAAVAQEVAEVIKEEGYTVLVQDYDIPYGANFVEEIHGALTRCRHLIVLLTKDYTTSRFTMMEVTNFLAAAGRSADECRLVVLRLEDCEPEGVLAGSVYADLFGVVDPGERKARILAAAEGRSTAQPRRHKLFENVPPRDEKFTGREDDLAEIHRMLTGADNVAPGKPIALYGLGGTGKSALAAEYAHRYANDYVGVWWAPAEKRTLLVSSLAMLGSRLDSRLANLSDDETAAKTALARLGGFATPLLLIYDNVETPEDLRDLVPSTGLRILMTTQWSDWSGRAADVRLESLREDSATLFLQARADRSDPSGAHRLAQALGCLPLALDHAGAYCRLVGESLSFDDYRKKIDTRITRPPKGYPKSVARTFNMAIEKAAAETPHAETLLGMFAFLAPERIPLGLLAENLLSEDDRSEALMALASVSLIEHHTFEGGAPAVTLHRMVQAAMRARVALNEKLKGVLEGVADCLSAAVPEGAYDEPLHWPICTKLLPHVLAFGEHASASGLRTGNFALLCDRMGEFLYARASLDSAKFFFLEAIDVGRVTLGPRDLAVAKAMNNLALVLHDQNPKNDVEPLFREALDIERERVGVEHPSYGRTLTSFANVLTGQGRSEEAEALLREAIALGEKALGRRHRDVAMRLGNLAILLQSKRQNREAEALFRESIESGEASLGREHPQIISRLNNLALLLQSENRMKEAEPLYKEAIAGSEKCLGEEHVYVGTCLQNLANLLRDTGRTSDAEPLYVRAIGILVQNLGIDHVLAARARTNYSKLLHAAGRISDAREHAEAALAVHSKAFGESHRWTQDSKKAVEACVDAVEGQPAPGRPPSSTSTANQGA
jgi:tetratricopeptide (TPR) repeat protein